jgi:Cysteine-rich secretory protein family
VTFVLALAVAMAPGGPQALAATSPGSFSQEILDAHNKYREAAGVPPLVWSHDLAVAARAWANTLSSNLDFAHETAVHDQGENLWIGTTGAFTPAQMVDGWGSERQYFYNGTFPNVSTTGNWFDVGHYTQMVWRNTTSVGCAGVAGSDGYYRLVCRYSPPGNVVGQPVF